MKRFEKFAQSQFKSLIKHLKNYYSSHESETLHQVRVDIKKLKAILRLINDCKKGFKAHKNFIPFRAIFRRADDIREPEVITGLLLKYQMDGIKDDLILTNGRHSANAFESDIPNLIKTVKSRRHKLKPYFKYVRRNEFMRYLRRKKRKVKSKLYPKPAMSIIHTIRKEIKEVIYLSVVDGKSKKKEINFYGKTQDTIGQLHDKQVLLEFLKNKIDAGSTAQKTIKSECLSHKREIFRLVYDYYG